MGSVRSSRRTTRIIRSAGSCKVWSAGRSTSSPLTRCLCFPVDVADGVSPSAYMGALGMTGLTAWIGIRDIGKPQAGRDGRRLGRGGCRRLGRRPAGQGRRRPRRRDRRRPREVRPADRAARLRRGCRPSRRRLGRPTGRRDPQRHRRRLRERRRRHHGRDLRPPQRWRARRAVRPDLRVQRRRSAAAGRVRSATY